MASNLSSLLSSSTPLIMGIINLTPDSFYDGGQHLTEKSVLNKVEQMTLEGASIIDIGAMSTRPGALSIDSPTEIQRLLGFVPEIRKKFPEIFLSIDTYRSEIAQIMIQEGANLINDISGGTLDLQMIPLMGKTEVGYILMHMQGQPENMQLNPTYRSVIHDIYHFFEKQLASLKRIGKTKNIILDPGFGFGKTVDHNYQILKHLHTFQDFDLPVMAGVSRKSMINKVLDTRPQQALNGTTVLHTLALLNGADILRVHDVKEAMQAIKLIEFYQQQP